MAVAACAGAPGSSSGPVAAGAAARFEALTALDRRVAEVAYRLMSANAELCPVTRLGAGWALHAARQYSLELRPVAEADGLAGDLPGILAAPQGSPAARAGLGRGDLILAVDGAPLTIGDLGGRPTYDGLSANVRVLDQAMGRGPTALTIRRAGSDRQVMLEPERACGYEVQLDPSDDLGARADGRRLFISTALAQVARTDDELAIVLGHELAHNVLGHREWEEAGGMGRIVGDRVIEPQAGSPEAEADRVGLYLMARAGYDPAVAAPFWRRLGAEHWRFRYPQLRHASAEVRAARLETEAAVIARKQAAGDPLRP